MQNHKSWMVLVVCTHKKWFLYQSYFSTLLTSPSLTTYFFQYKIFRNDDILTEKDAYLSLISKELLWWPSLMMRHSQCLVTILLKNIFSSINILFSPPAVQSTHTKFCLSPLLSALKNCWGVKNIYLKYMASIWPETSLKHVVCDVIVNILVG